MSWIFLEDDYSDTNYVDMADRDDNKQNYMKRFKNYQFVGYTGDTAPHIRASISTRVNNINYRLDVIIDIYDPNATRNSDLEHVGNWKYFYKTTTTSRVTDKIWKNLCITCEYEKNDNSYSYDIITLNFYLDGENLTDTLRTPPREQPSGGITNRLTDNEMFISDMNKTNNLIIGGFEHFPNLSTDGSVVELKNKKYEIFYNNIKNTAKYKYANPVVISGKIYDQTEIIELMQETDPK